MSDRSIRMVVPLVVVTGVATVSTGTYFLHREPVEAVAFAPQGQAAPQAPAQSEGPGPSPGESAQEPAAAGLGLVRVNYRLHRLPQLASNQIAVWIEDAGGTYIRTLFATSFTANGGYVRRPESLVEWRAAAQWESAPQDEVESASRPAQDSGDQTLYWDGTDRTGRPVPPGDYVYRIEGNTSWENRIMFTGTITLGEEPSSSAAEQEFLPAAAERDGTMVEDVGAEFSPGEPLDPAVLTAFTRGS
ncbi:DUF2271 domain-containing protein [Nocardiopsis mangrovi]|uniref:DUF2271 domain-containing protein n=1 Tax=Nocardiopsis mangrovi TaxID=1179818 RepID=A0ABV9DYV0_9ACTN